MIKQKKMKAFSNFAYKGIVGAIAGVYLILFGLAFWNIFSYNSQVVWLSSSFNRARSNKKAAFQS